jgi:type VI secretion system protein ImpG
MWCCCSGRSSEVLAARFRPTNFRLFATPAINLFEKQLGRTRSTSEHEFHVVADRTRPLDFEVFRLIDVQAHVRDSVDSRARSRRSIRMGALLYDWRDALFYVPRLSPAQAVDQASASC